MRRMHLGQGFSERVVSLLASCVPFTSLSSSKSSKHLRISSSELQSLVLQKGKPWFLLSLRQISWLLSMQQRLSLLEPLRVVVVSTPSFRKPSLLELYSMLNLLLCEACASTHRYTFWSPSIEFSLIIFFTFQISMLVSVESNSKSAGSSRVGQRGLDSEQTLALSLALPMVWWVQKVTCSLSRQYFRSTSSSLLSFFDSSTSTLCFSGISMQLLEAMIRKWASNLESFLSTACWKASLFVTSESRITQLGQQAFSLSGSTWMYCRGLKSNRLTELSEDSGKGHSEGLMERSSDFQMLQTTLRSTTSGLQKMVAECLGCLGRKQQCEVPVMSLTAQLCQIPSFSSTIAFSFISVIVVSISTSIRFSIRTNSQQFSPSFSLHSRSDTRLRSITSTYLSTVNQAVFSALSYSSTLLILRLMLTARWMLWVQKLRMVRSPASNSKTQSRVSLGLRVSQWAAPVSSRRLASLVEAMRVKWAYLSTNCSLFSTFIAKFSPLTSAFSNLMNPSEDSSAAVQSSLLFCAGLSSFRTYRLSSLTGPMRLKQTSSFVFILNSNTSSLSASSKRQVNGMVSFSSRNGVFSSNTVSVNCVQSRPMTSKMMGPSSLGSKMAGKWWLKLTSQHFFSMSIAGHRALLAAQTTTLGTLIRNCRALLALAPQVQCLFCTGPILAVTDFYNFQQIYSLVVMVADSPKQIFPLLSSKASIENMQPADGQDTALALIFLEEAKMWTWSMPSTSLPTGISLYLMTWPFLRSKKESSPSQTSCTSAAMNMALKRRVCPVTPSSISMVSYFSSTFLKTTLKSAEVFSLSMSRSQQEMTVFLPPLMPCRITLMLVSLLSSFMVMSQAWASIRKSLLGMDLNSYEFYFSGYRKSLKNLPPPKMISSFMCLRVALTHCLTWSSVLVRQQYPSSSLSNKKFTRPTPRCSTATRLYFELVQSTRPLLNLVARSALLQKAVREAWFLSLFTDTRLSTEWSPSSSKLAGCRMIQLSSQGVFTHSNPNVPVTEVTLGMTQSWVQLLKMHDLVSVPTFRVIVIGLVDRVVSLASVLWGLRINSRALSFSRSVMSQPFLLWVALEQWLASTTVSRSSGVAFSSWSTYLCLRPWSAGVRRARMMRVKNKRVICSYIMIPISNDLFVYQTFTDILAIGQQNAVQMMLLSLC